MSLEPSSQLKSNYIQKKEFKSDKEDFQLTSNMDRSLMGSSVNKTIL